MGAVFGNITVMQFADLLILFGLLVLIIVLAVLIAAHFSGSRRQQKLILSHIDGTITEIRDAVVAGNQEKQQEESPDSAEKQEEERKVLTVVRIDNRIGSSLKRKEIRKPAVVRIDGRVEEEAEESGESAESVKADPEERKEHEPARQAAEEGGSLESAKTEIPDITETPREEKKAEDKDGQKPEDVVSEEHESRNIRYRSRDCGVDKNGKTYSVDQLREQIR
ncbi:MAG: hypothetical protein ACFNYI_01755 [Eubacterium sp.]